MSLMRPAAKRSVSQTPVLVSNRQRERKMVFEVGKKCYGSFAIVLDTSRMFSIISHRTEWFNWNGANFKGTRSYFYLPRGFISPAKRTTWFHGIGHLVTILSSLQPPPVYPNLPESCPANLR